MREGHSGCPFLLGAPICHRSLRIRVSTVCAEAGREAISSGFEPAKALVRGLPLPRPPSFRDHLGRLPVLWPIRGVGHPRCMGEHGATSDRLVAKGGRHEWGGVRASCSAYSQLRSDRCPWQRVFQGPTVAALLSAAPCGPHGKTNCRGTLLPSLKRIRRSDKDRSDSRARSVRPHQISGTPRS